VLPSHGVMSGYVGNPLQFPMNASIDSERLIDRIYEAGLVPSLWPALLGELGAAVGGNGGFLFGVRDGYTSAVNSVEYDQLMPVFRLPPARAALLD
jgi:hypothetical protein